MALSTERRGEIADKLLRYYVAKKGIPTLSAGGLRRELGSIAEKIGVSLNELVEYYREVVHSLLAEAFSPKAP